MLEAIILIIAGAWIFYRVFFEKTFLFWTWKDGTVTNVFRSDSE